MRWSPALIFVLLTPAFGLDEKPYDPLAIAEKSGAATMDLTVHDARRSRDLPIKVYLAAAKGVDPGAAPVVLFSHGLGGSKDNNAYLGNHWAGRGYMAVFVQHPGSDEGVWKDTPKAERLEAMRKAASIENTLLRFRDVPAVLDQLGRWNTEEGHPLFHRLDLDRVGMSGHSFGAVTTQAVSGQLLAGRVAMFTDPRIRAAVIMSPSIPKNPGRSGAPEQAFGKVKLPWLLMTGTHDVSIIGDADMKSRLGVFPALPSDGKKYQVVLDGAEHSAFSERALAGDALPRNPNHHRAILALTTAFWDAYLRDDPAARAWLDGDGPRTVLEPKDGWDRK
jgi:predicted dienelactone hydrolase